MVVRAVRVVAEEVGVAAAAEADAVASTFKQTPKTIANSCNKYRQRAKPLPIHGGKMQIRIQNYELLNFETYSLIGSEKGISRIKSKKLISALEELKPTCDTSIDIQALEAILENTSWKNDLYLASYTTIWL